mgnify:FL=1
MKHALRVGVVGVGHVGSLHAQVYAKLRGARLVAVCDVDRARSREVAKPLGCQALTDATELIGLVDAASIAVPTSLHHAVGKTLLDAGIHVLIEKPITTTLAQADELLALAARRQALVQVGHIERFNAAIQTAKAHLTHPRFIEAHRLSPYPHRGTDVSVVLDVMIHDLDLVLALVKCQPAQIDALGVPILSMSEDIANARLVFPTGCVANLTASRVSDERIRRIRLFQEDCYLSIDYQHQSVELARKIGRTIRRKTLAVRRRPPLDEELTAFLKAVRTGTTPLNSPGQAGVSGEEAREALALALKIEQAMRSSEFGMRNKKQKKR